MASLFKWVPKPPPPAPEIGAQRIVRRLLLAPHAVNGQFRWLGWEGIVQVRKHQIIRGRFGGTWTHRSGVDKEWAR